MTYSPIYLLHVTSDLNQISLITQILSALPQTGVPADHSDEPEPASTVAVGEPGAADVEVPDRL